MAKKKKNGSDDSNGAPGDLPDDSPGDQPEVRAAEEALRRAREELHHAQQRYEEIRQKAAERIEQVREMKLGDMVDQALELVRQHPGPSLLGAFLLGIFLDRYFRK